MQFLFEHTIILKYILNGLFFLKKKKKMNKLEKEDYYKLVSSTKGTMVE